MTFRECRTRAFALAVALLACEDRPSPKPNDGPRIQLSRSQVAFEMTAFDASSIAPALATVEVVNVGEKPDPEEDPAGEVTFLAAESWLDGGFWRTTDGWQLELAPARLALLDARVYQATVWIYWGTATAPEPVEVTLTVRPHARTWAEGSAHVRPGRMMHTTTALPDGSAVVIGGRRGTFMEFLPPEPVIERFDPSTGEWSEAGTMWRAREQHTATLLADGKVFVAGGTRLDASASIARSTWELYDPATEAVTHGTLTPDRTSHAAVLLRDGRVLLVGGTSTVTGQGANLRTCQLVDATTSPPTFTDGGTLNGTALRSDLALLADGRVLATTTVDGVETGTEIFDPGTRQWTLATPRLHRRDHHATVALPDGRVLVFGGSVVDSGTRVFPPAAELWDPETGEWSEVPEPLAHRLSAYDAVVVLPGGEVLVAGGITDWPDGRVVMTTLVEVFDPGSLTWSIDGALVRPRGHHTVTLLEDGRLLAVGGIDAGDHAELWQEPP
ncbi:MAG TPA: kelch repeat-containing protein [Anaeromyxobacter sp.]|nr:kelch repeat-containing protein [Anaeromyxobacter sp.]